MRTTEMRWLNTEDELKDGLNYMHLQIRSPPKSSQSAYIRMIHYLRERASISPSPRVKELRYSDFAALESVSSVSHVITLSLAECSQPLRSDGTVCVNAALG